MKIIIDTPEKIAEKAALRYVELLSNKPDAILGLATGSTPVGLYNELVKLNKEGKISFKNVTTFNLDEYVGLEPTHDQSYRYFMNQHLLSHVDVDMEKTNVPSGINLDEAASYDSKISSAGGIDLQLLGIGNNGHIGFNEPCDKFVKDTNCVTLAQSTIDANARFFASKEDVPTHAVTMGMGNIMRAQALLMIISGSKEEAATKLLIEDKIDPKCPATFMRMHRDATVVLTQELADKIGYKA